MSNNTPPLYTAQLNDKSANPGLWVMFYKEKFKAFDMIDPSTIKLAEQCR